MKSTSYQRTDNDSDLTTLGSEDFNDFEEPLFMEKETRKAVPSSVVFRSASASADTFFSAANAIYCNNEGFKASAPCQQTDPRFFVSTRNSSDFNTLRSEDFSEMILETFMTGDYVLIPV
jgi:hypothetical protein